MIEKLLGLGNEFTILQSKMTAVTTKKHKRKLQKKNVGFVVR